MTEPDSAVFDRLLEDVDLTVRRTERRELAARQRVHAAADVTTLIYVLEGELRGATMPACSVARDGGRVTAVPARPAGGFRSGSAVLTLGRGTHTLEAACDSTVLIVTLDLSETAQRLHELLPEPLTLLGFPALDPAGAALASNMGIAEVQGGAGHAAPQAAGSSVVCRLMAHTVLLAVLRSWYGAGCAPRGWSARAADPQLDRVLTAIHDEPGRDWSLETLAALGAMSRSMFARRFRDTLGATPGQYLARIRMEDAKRRLATGTPVSQVSRELGYASDEGFSRAFRRHTGVVPSRWRWDSPNRTAPATRSAAPIP